MRTLTNLPNWTSLLYLPGHTAEASASPLGCRPDAVVLDLEDFVPSDEKRVARARVPSLAQAFASQGLDTLVRINRRLDLAVEDLDRVVVEDVKAVMVTKVSSAEHLLLLDEFVASLEAQRGLVPGHIRFVAMIETASALTQVDRIACSVDRLVALTLGGEDLARECGMRSSRHTLTYPKQKLVHAAAAAGIQPWGYLASVADYTDHDLFVAMLQDSRDFGFRSATCLLPAQVEAVNAIYARHEARPP